MSGANEPCSISRILWSYSRCFSCSCPRKTELRGVLQFDAARGLKTLTSKNASWPGHQNPLHRMSTLLSSWALALRLVRDSPERGWSWGSVSMFVLTSNIRDAVKSRMSLCQWMGNPPVLQLRACWTSLLLPHAQIVAMPDRCHPHRSASASLNASLCSILHSMHTRMVWLYTYL